ncbi:MAG: class I SAM-dependent methyltransferase, partial [Thermodesulfobacteriota bacterium]
YQRWIYERIRPFLRGDILEIGCGIGNLTGFLLSHGKVGISDINEEYLQITEEKFRGHPNLKEIFLWDIRQNPPESLTTLFDTIVCSNVLEHIEDDEAVLRNLYHYLPNGGRLILLVPAIKGLYNRLDLELGHIRRYSKRELGQMISKSGLRIILLTYFNFFGILGWFLNGTILRRPLLPEGQLRIFDRMVPFFIQIERVIPIRLGQSLIAVAERGKI